MNQDQEGWLTALLSLTSPKRGLSPHLHKRGEVGQQDASSHQAHMVEENQFAKLSSNLSHMHPGTHVPTHKHKVEICSSRQW